MTSLVRESTPVQNLGSRTIKGTFWLFLGKGYQQILLLCKVTILGRLLGPEEFGLVGIALLTVQFLATFTHTGFASALIQQPDLNDRDISTAWWVLLGRGTLIAGVLFLFSPWIAAIFKEPRAIPVLRAFGGIQFLLAFASIGIVLLSKSMEFNKLFKYEAWSSTIELVVAVAIALWYPSVWALVGGIFAGTVVRVVLSYVIYPYFPRFTFDMRSAINLFKFGQWLLFGAMVFYIFSRAADAMSGIMFGVAALGIYQMASRFALLPTSQIGELFLNAIFPAYSLIQNDAEKLKLTFLKVLQIAAFVIFPLTALMIVVVAPIIPMVLGVKWVGVVSLIPGVALGGMIQAMLRTGAPLFMAKGKPKLLFAVDLISALGVLILIYPFAKYFGLVGLAWAYFAGLALGIPLWWHMVKSQSGLSNREIMVAILPTLLASAILAISVGIPAKIFLSGHILWFFFSGLAVLSMVGIILFLILTLMMERLIPEYKPISNTLALMKTYFNSSKGEVTEVFC